jgi:hypothetical protein
MNATKSTAEYAATVRRIANKIPINRIEDITDLNEAAGILEDLAQRERHNALEEPLNILEDEA